LPLSHERAPGKNLHLSHKNTVQSFLALYKIGRFLSCRTTLTLREEQGNRSVRYMSLHMRAYVSGCNQAACRWTHPGSLVSHLDRFVCYEVLKTTFDYGISILTWCKTNVMHGVAHSNYVSWLTRNRSCAGSSWTQLLHIIEETFGMYIRTSPLDYMDIPTYIVTPHLRISAS
jgi:hypothetical protein